MPLEWFGGEGHGIYSLRSASLEVKLIMFLLIDIASILLAFALAIMRLVIAINLGRY